MSKSCKVIAAVTVEGLEYFAQNTTAGAYICTASGIYAGPFAPIVCGTAAISTAAGKWATTPAGKELMTLAAEKGCTVVVNAGEIVLVAGGETIEAINKTAKEAEKTYNALNTELGISWLMRKLTGGF